MRRSEAIRQSRRVQDDRRFCCLIAAARYRFLNSSGKFSTFAAIRRAT
jgi:hypothetical protein